MARMLEKMLYLANLAVAKKWAQRYRNLESGSQSADDPLWRAADTILVKYHFSPVFTKGFKVMPIFIIEFPRLFYTRQKLHFEKFWMNPQTILIRIWNTKRIRKIVRFTFKMRYLTICVRLFLPLKPIFIQYGCVRLRKNRGTGKFPTFAAKFSFCSITQSRVKQSPS